jgi:hypothetical protein
MSICIVRCKEMGAINDKQKCGPEGKPGRSW